jgi:hypothetical protein
MPRARKASMRSRGGCPVSVKLAHSLQRRRSSADPRRRGGATWSGGLPEARSRAGRSGGQDGLAEHLAVTRGRGATRAVRLGRAAGRVSDRDRAAPSSSGSASGGVLHPVLLGGPSALGQAWPTWPSTYARQNRVTCSGRRFPRTAEHEGGPTRAKVCCSGTWRDRQRSPCLDGVRIGHRVVDMCDWISRTTGPDINSQPATTRRPAISHGYPTRCDRALLGSG